MPRINRDIIHNHDIIIKIIGAVTRQGSAMFKSHEKPVFIARRKKRLNHFRRPETTAIGMLDIQNSGIEIGKIKLHVFPLGL